MCHHLIRNSGLRNMPRTRLVPLSWANLASVHPVSESCVTDSKQYPLQPIYRMHLFVSFRCHGVMSVCADFCNNILLLSLDLLHNLFASDKIGFSNYILIYLSNLPARVDHP